MEIDKSFRQVSFVADIYALILSWKWKAKLETLAPGHLEDSLGRSDSPVFMCLVSNFRYLVRWVNGSQSSLILTIGDAVCLSGRPSLTSQEPGSHSNPPISSKKISRRPL